MNSSESVYVGLGSNLGERKEYLGRGRDCLGNSAGRLTCSTISETEPVGVKTDQKFLNQVVLLESHDFVSAVDCLEALLEAERKIGRDRESNEPDRIIDLDLLYFGQRVNTPDPVVPHPRLHRRRFVLEPLNELSPGFVHPVFGVDQQALLEHLEKSGA